MEVLKGNRRYVILIGEKAIKVARFRFTEAWGKIKKHFKDGDLAFELVIPSYKQKDSIAYFLRAGIVANIVERFQERFRYKVYNEEMKFVCPTTSSLLGVVNFQDRVTSVNMSDEKWEEFIDYAMGNTRMLQSSNLRGFLLNKSNFGVLNGKLVVLKYGYGQIINQDLRLLSKLMNVNFIDGLPEIEVQDD